MSTVTITRIAHSSVLIDFAGQTILTDPWFSEKFGYYHGEPYGIALPDLPHLTGVIASHGHYDHFDMQSFRAYPDKQVPIVVKRGKGEMAATARAAGFPLVTELEPWEHTVLGEITITAIPAKHGVPEITYMLQAHGLTVYFGGDTLFIPEHREIPQRFPHIDAALLAVNGLEIRTLLGNKHVVMNAKEAAALCAIIQPRYAIPIHYAFTGGPIVDRVALRYTGSAEEFTQVAAQVVPQMAICLLAPGVSLSIESL